MEYKELIEKLKKYNKIIVSGPQRSGTTFAASALSKTLGYKYLDETEYKNDPLILNEIINKSNNLIVQGPAQCHRLQDIDGLDLIIIMKRNIEDIIKSQDRIDWTRRFEQVEVDNYRKRFGSIIDNNFYENKTISVIKYAIFEKYQIDMITCDAIILEYNTMQNSEYYIKKSNRTNFKSKQTK